MKLVTETTNSSSVHCGDESSEKQGFLFLISYMQSDLKPVQLPSAGH